LASHLRHHQLPPRNVFFFFRQVYRILYQS
jgi:hypothetical protein